MTQAVICPEVLHKDQKIKIKSSSVRGISQYIEKKTLAEQLNRSRTMLSDWEEILIKKSPDFRRYYSPGNPWNDFQAFCIELIHEWREEIKTHKIPSSAYEQFVSENSQLFTLENYRNVVFQHTKANNSRSSSAIEVKPQASY